MHRAIYVDTKTGTWGDAADLVIVDNPTEEQEEFLSVAGDDRIINFGQNNGREVR
jgi:hypothetical protein